MRLPTFKGYTVDIRLRQFRKVEVGKLFECIAFDSERGLALLQEMEEDPEAIKTYQGERPCEVAYEADKAVRCDRSRSYSN